MIKYRKRKELFSSSKRFSPKEKLKGGVGQMRASTYPGFPAMSRGNLEIGGRVIGFPILEK